MIQWWFWVDNIVDYVALGTLIELTLRFYRGLATHWLSVLVLAGVWFKRIYDEGSECKHAITTADGSLAPRWLAALRDYAWNIGTLVDLVKIAADFAGIAVLASTIQFGDAAWPACEGERE